MSVSKIRVLFIQHAGALGGSALSLLYTMRELRGLGYVCEVALIRPCAQLHALYEDSGFTVYDVAGIGIFSHTTGGWARLGQTCSLVEFVKELLLWRRSERETLRLVNTLKPDIVHLNSAVLAPSASALRKANIPFVWHIRECPPHQGLRTSFLRRAMLSSHHVIFISVNDREQWVKGAHGTIIPNFVKWETIEGSATRAQARFKLGIRDEDPVVLYVGGLSWIKGFRVLLKATPLVQQKLPNVRFLMLASRPVLAECGFKKWVQTILPRIGWGTPGQMLVQRIRRNNLAENVRLLPFSDNVWDYYAACDILVFPSIEPHFARPVIEAAAMARPVVASDIGGVRELIENEETGLLVPPGNHDALAMAILRLLSNAPLACCMGIKGQTRARMLYNAANNAQKIAELYALALKGISQR